MTTKPKCLARLTSWERTNSTIGTSKKRASIIKLCKNIPEKGEVICQECSERPIDGKYQTRMIHGLLTDPPCESSHIYGSVWYWQQVAMYGEPDDKEWLVSAQKAQKGGEGFCFPVGGWKVQSPSETELEGMYKSKKEKNKAVAVSRVAASAAAESAKAKANAKAILDTKGTILEKFAQIKVIYEESEKSPEKLPTDTCGIWKDVIDGMDVWRSGAGHIFDHDTTGEAGEFIGRIVDDKLIRVK